MSEEYELKRFGERVRRIREQRGLSVDAVARGSGLAPQQISALEAGQDDATFDVLFALARGLGVSPSTLMPD